MRWMVRHVPYGEVAGALNRLVRKGVITSFKTNFADRDEPGWVPEVTVVPVDETAVEGALDRVEEAIFALGVQTITAELSSSSESGDKP
jgi:hypothetical protein